MRNKANPKDSYVSPQRLRICKMLFFPSEYSLGLQINPALLRWDPLALPLNFIRRWGCRPITKIILQIELPLFREFRVWYKQCLVFLVLIFQPVLCQSGKNLKGVLLCPHGRHEGREFYYRWDWPPLSAQFPGAVVSIGSLFFALTKSPINYPCLEWAWAPGGQQSCALDDRGWMEETQPCQ